MSLAELAINFLMVGALFYGVEGAPVAAKSRRIERDLGVCRASLHVVSERAAGLEDEQSVTNAALRSASHQLDRCTDDLKVAKKNLSPTLPVCAVAPLFDAASSPGGSFVIAGSHYSIADIRQHWGSKALGRTADGRKCRNPVSLRADADGNVHGHAYGALQRLFVVFLITQEGFSEERANGKSE